MSNRWGYGAMALIAQLMTSCGGGSSPTAAPMLVTPTGIVGRSTQQVTFSAPLPANATDVKWTFWKGAIPAVALEPEPIVRLARPGTYAANVRYSIEGVRQAPIEFSYTVSDFAAIPTISTIVTPDTRGGESVHLFQDRVIVTYVDADGTGQFAVNDGLQEPGFSTWSTHAPVPGAYARLASTVEDELLLIRSAATEFEILRGGEGRIPGSAAEWTAIGHQNGWFGPDDLKHMAILDVTRVENRLVLASGVSFYFREGCNPDTSFNCYSSPNAFIEVAQSTELEPTSWREFRFSTEIYGGGISSLMKYRGGLAFIGVESWNSPQPAVWQTTTFPPANDSNWRSIALPPADRYYRASLREADGLLVARYWDQVGLRYRTVHTVVNRPESFEDFVPLETPYLLPFGPYGQQFISDANGGWLMDFDESLGPVLRRPYVPDASDPEDFGVTLINDVSRPELSVIAGIPAGDERYLLCVRSALTPELRLALLSLTGSGLTGVAP